LRRLMLAALLLLAAAMRARASSGMSSTA
jgi:hypothetical protein